MNKKDDNNITSIEQLQFINMPHLEELVLCKNLNKLEKNKITKTSAFNKCSWNSMKFLNLSNKLITEKATIELIKLSFQDSRNL